MFNLKPNCVAYRTLASNVCWNPMQRVVEGIMFLTRPSFSQSFKPIFCQCRTYCVDVHISMKFWFHFFFSVSCACFELWPKWNIWLKEFVIETPLKPLHRILWNFVVMKDTLFSLQICCNFLFNYFSSNYAPFELRSLSKILYHIIGTVFNCNSTEFHVLVTL